MLIFETDINIFDQQKNAMKYFYDIRKNLSLFLLLLGTIVSIVSLSSFEKNNNSPHFIQNAYGHNLTPNESASFLAFVDKLQVESELVQTNLANNNISLAQEHAKKANVLLTPNITKEIAERNQRVAEDLTTAVSNLQNTSSEQQQQPVSQLVSDIDAILGEAVTTRIDQEQRDNTAIQALAFANLVDSVLRNYGNAYAVGFDMTNISNVATMMGSNNNSSMAISSMVDDNNNNSNMNMDLMNMSSSTMMGMDTGMNRNYSLVNTADYQSAQALATRALEVFDSELEPMASNNATSFITNLENGLTQLNNSIRNKASPMDIMMIGHTQVHPNLMEAFNLELQ
jgi:hypothetical protein